MRIGLVTCSLLLSLNLTALRADDNAKFDWDQWRSLPVQDWGRAKPFDTLAWETIRTISNRASLKESQSGQRLDANTLYLVLLFDWQGWDQPPGSFASAPSPAGTNYFRAHRPDRWDRMPLLRIDFLTLRDALSVPEDRNCVSPWELSLAKVRVPGIKEEQPFLMWAESLVRLQDEGLTTFEQKALELADKFGAYQTHRSGQGLLILPIQGSEDQQWISLAEVVLSEWDETSDPTGSLRQIQQQFRIARQAYFAGSAEDFNRASASLIATVRGLGPQLGVYPRQRNIDLEVTYNRWAPFRIAWIFSVVCFLALLLSMGTGWKPFYVGGWAAMLAGLAAMLVGFGMRVAISGRAPVANMYESVIYVGLGVTVFGMLFEMIFRKQYVLTAAAAVATVALVLADTCPAALDPSVQPLQPVLRSNFWLVIHVLTITLSYAALALAMGLGNITLGYYLAGSTNQQTIQDLTQLTYRAIQVGVLLLAAGTILGGVWADYSWGRFWGWDPKEVWALIALLGYLAALHARYAGWVRQFGLAVLSVTCFSLVVMAWYGVNFVLGAGLHSYGFGGGGKNYVLAALVAQLAFAAIAALRHASQLAAEQRSQVSTSPRSQTQASKTREPALPG
ncbi:MAG: cytochrome c biogenesis protein CcsA [Planctomycetes bacterium]|nr:cytochrome c biogenesis protein CcsA [Planctomycetota bacterium]